jgi:hypothetical protein
MAIYRDICTIVFKTSNRKNARTKIKVFKNKTPDDILKVDKLTGIPINAIILEIGFGQRLNEIYKHKYKL